MERMYYQRIWYIERRLFKNGLMRWFTEDLKPKERRAVIKEFYKAGSESGLFPHEVNRLCYKFFGISLFCTKDVWRFVQVLDMPTWVLREILKLKDAEGYFSSWKIAHELYKRCGVFISANLIWTFLTRTDTHKVITEKEKHDVITEKALREVGRVEGDFVLAIEEDGCDLFSVYREFGKRFKELPLQYLFFYANCSTYYTALVDAAIIDIVAERMERNPPELWRNLVKR